MEEEKGSSKLVIYLDEVTAPDVDHLLNEIADLLRENGLGATDENSVIRSLVSVEHWEWPEKDNDLMEQVIARAQVLLVPSAQGSELPELMVRKKD